MHKNSKHTLLKIGAGALVVLATTVVSGATETAKPTVHDAIRVAAASAMMAAPAMKSENTLGGVQLSPDVTLKGNMSMKVSPATAKLLQALSRSISSTVRANAGASSEYVQYGYGSSVDNATHQELVVR